jgi:indole-3-glycerol phosphate synthase
MVDFLAEVALKTRQRVTAQKNRLGLDELRARLKHVRAGSSLRKALRRPGELAVIAELKPASPSAGVIRVENQVESRIAAYLKGGAAALSILTEEEYFRGSPHLLEMARGLTSAPILRKDFIIDPYQIVESRTLGADAILLIESLLPGPMLAEFMKQCDDVGLDALVEVHDESGLARALEANVQLLGINNRDLRTLKVDTRKAADLLAKIPAKGITVVVESGMKDPAELPEWRDRGAHAVLIGETFMRSEDPEKTVKEFVQACRK